MVTCFGRRLAIEKAAHLDEYSVINIGQGDFRSIKELADLICEKLGANPNLIQEVDLPGRMTLKKRPYTDPNE